MSDFLFHNVSESERDQIKKQAKAIMDGFSEKLSTLKEKIPEPIIERDEFEREEKELLATSSVNSQSKGKNPSEDFKKRFFENASNKNENFILTEKKKW